MSTVPTPVSAGPANLQANADTIGAAQTQAAASQAASIAAAAQAASDQQTVTTDVQHQASDLAAYIALLQATYGSPPAPAPVVAPSAS